MYFYYKSLCIIIVVYVLLLFVHVFLTLSMYSYCGLCILIVRPCILIVVYVYLLLSTSKFLCCSQNCCVVLCIVCFVLFYVLFVCKCVLPPGDNPIAVNKYIIKERASMLRYTYLACLVGYKESNLQFQNVIVEVLLN